ACVDILTHLNKDAARVMKDFDVHGVTDITGFGLAGHALEMAKSSGALLQIDVGALPVMDEALAMYKRGMSTGVNPFNRNLVKDYVRDESTLPPIHKEILYDPQTSGGLLVALPKEQAAELVRLLKQIKTPSAVVIGKVLEVSGTAGLVIR
ncbi:MAG: AIR synthase-related protein, partial [Desulfocapsaceae bacterium]|nr:AIR synthase-related protein [Desulfocapsaceae bacterium]